MTRLIEKAGAALLFLAVACGLLLAGAPPAGAHTGDQSYVYLDVGENTLGGRVEFPFADLRKVFGMKLPEDESAALAELEAKGDELRAFAEEHLAIGLAGVDLPTTFEGIELLEGEEWVEYAVLPFTVDLGGATPPRNIDVTFDPFFDEIPGRDGLLLIGNNWGAGVIENGDEVLVAFDGNTRSRTIDLGEQSWWRSMGASIELGLDHIRTGPDHIFFVLVLLLPSVLVFSRGSWEPSGSFGSGLWRVLKIATMFTVAHSITFSLAGLGILPLPPSKLVEAIIAASIAAAALHNLRPIAPNKEWAIAFAFGLFHGLGFASLVADLDVSRSTQLISLLGRNIGIEIGQVIVIVLMFPALHLARRTRLYKPAFTITSVLLAVVSLGWMIERLAEVELGINGIVDKLIKFPRSILLAVVLAAIAGAIYWNEKRAGRLLPVHSGPVVAGAE